MKKSFIIVALLVCQIFFANHSRACTRVVYQGPDSIIITARSMDWKTDIPAALWIFPRGMERDGAAGPNAIKWVSKYGRVVTSSFGNSSADGS
jgi:choloylglycine hydrolase